MKILNRILRFLFAGNPQIILLSKNLSGVEKLAEISFWTMVRSKRFSYRQIRISIVQCPIIYPEPLRLLEKSLVCRICAAEYPGIS